MLPAHILARAGESLESKKKHIIHRVTGNSIMRYARAAVARAFSGLHENCPFRFQLSAAF